VAEKPEKLVPQSFRLPAHQVAAIKALIASGALGSNRSAVARALLESAIQDLIKTDYVKKFQALVKGE